MPAPKYIFKKEAAQAIKEIIKGEDIWIGDYESEPDMFYFNQGSGADAVTFIINQETGLVEVKYSEPGRQGNPPYMGNNEKDDIYADLGDDEDNEWYKSGVADNIKYALDNLVVESAAGGKRKSKRNNRKSRKSTRRNNRR
jgi:hypothetical protein